MINDPIAHLSYAFDRKILSDIYSASMEQVEAYGDPQHGPVRDWFITRVEDDEYISSIKKAFRIPNAKPRFYRLKANASLPEHVDMGTKCSINVLLSDEPAPIIIEGREFYYTSCLLNTQRNHYVVNGPIDRLLFKLSILDQEFDEVYANNLNSIV